MQLAFRTVILSAWAFCAALPLFAQNFNLTQRAVVNFPGQNLANIWGYAANGREYALVGGSRGLIIVEVTNPAAPVILKQVPGPVNNWKEIKTYKNYAYVVSEGGQGVQVVDLSRLPDTSNMSVTHYKGDGTIAGRLNTIHALHIDEKKGFLYAHGTNLFSGAPVILDLKDPAKPTYAGTYQYPQQAYVHDGFADNDTLYAAHIYAGVVAMVDIRDKANPKLLGTIQTPGKFTHNTWLLGNRKTILTTDEATPSFVTAYDVSDPSDIKELSRFATTPNGLGAIGHNTHVLNDWAITSWYTDGVSIVDAHRPENLIEVARFDTWPGAGANFEGCWGVYPYFPSGTVVASNISNPAQMFVLTPTYKRAAYFEGRVRSSCDNLPLADVSIRIAKDADQASTATNTQGVFKTGHVNAGTYTVTISKAGFETRTLTANLEAGKVLTQDVLLTQSAPTTFNGTVVDAASNAPLADIPIAIAGPQGTLSVRTDANGQFRVNCLNTGNYDIVSGRWGYLPINQFNLSSTGTYVLSLKKGYYDDFGIDMGWTNTTTPGTGAWVRGVPIGTQLNGALVNPDADSPKDPNNQCYVTGNGGGQAGTDDVDAKRVTLTSPVMQLAAYNDAELTFDYWFADTGGSGTAPNDTFQVHVGNGNITVPVFTQTASSSTWRSAGPIRLKNFLPLTNNMRLYFITGDADPGHAVEAAVDVVRVEPIGVSGVAQVLDETALVQVQPNPSAAEFRLQYDWPTAHSTVRMEVRNLLGQLLESQTLADRVGSVTFGAALPKGMYLVQLRTHDRLSRPFTIVKQ